MPSTLNTTYAIRVQWKKDLQSVALITVLVPVFLLLFQPFGIFRGTDFGSSIVLLAVLGFGLISGFVTFVFWVVFPVIFKRYFANFVRWQALVFLLAYLLFLAVIIYGYVSGLQGNYHFSWAKFLVVLSRTFLITPVFVTVWLAYSQRKRTTRIPPVAAQPERASREESCAEEISVTFGEAGEFLRLTTHNLLFVESANNYCLIYFLESGKVQRVMYRITLKEVAAKICTLPGVMRCHRSFIVNMAKVNRSAGNSRGAALFLGQVNRNIPVSRKHIGRMKESLAT